MKTPITWYGGKQLMLKHILPNVPPADECPTYTESFFGGGAVLFALEPRKCEVINDVNREATNFYSYCIKDFKGLQYEVSTTLHSHGAFNDAKVVYTHPHLFDEKKRAWAFHTLASQSFSSNLSTFAFDKVGKTTMTQRNKRLNFTEAIQQRLANVTVECDDALKVLTRYDSATTFHYIDPPYFNSDCGHYGGYTKEHFAKLLERITTLKGKFLLSSYPSDILKQYQSRFKWHVKEVEKKVLVTKYTNKTKIEVLTANYPLC